MSKLVSRQKGFTLLETLIGLALMAILAIAITSITTRIVTSQADNTARITAVRQVENGMHWLSHDIKQAQYIEMQAPSGFPATFRWTGWDNNEYTVTYSISGGNLTRDYTAGGETSSMVATRYVAVDPGLTSCANAGPNIAVTLTVTIGGTHSATETRAVEIFPCARVNR